MIIVIFSLIILSPCDTSKASDNLATTCQSSFVITKAPATQSNEYFRLVETRIIDAQSLDDQKLESLSPSLVAPKSVKIASFQQREMRDYHHSICFKRCHGRNDFSASDYTHQQWCQLIEKNGHSIFSQIPWENQGSKEKLLRYLTTNAKKASPGSEGIGAW